MPVPSTCCGFNRVSHDVYPDLSAVGKLRQGFSNASTIFAVGAGGLVSSCILDGAPFEGSAYHGYFTDIEVVAAYPISVWRPAVGLVPGYWERTRTGTQTWTRTHTGGSVVSSAAAITFTDDYEGSSMTLGPTETIVPGRDDDPDDFCDGYLSRSASSVTATTEVVKSDLLSYVAANLPSAWMRWEDAAVGTEFANYGISAGIIIYGGYEATDKPYRADRLAAKWAGTVQSDNFQAAPGVSAAYVGEPGLTLYVQVETYTVDSTDDPPTESSPTPVTVTCPWNADGYWSEADLADVQAPGGWVDIVEYTPGTVSGVDLVSDWSMDLGIMLLR